MTNTTSLLFFIESLYPYSGYYLSSARISGGNTTLTDIQLRRIVLHVLYIIEATTHIWLK